MSTLNKAWKRWKEVILITLFVRVILFLVAFFFNPDSQRDFWNIWIRWDGPHYLEIAQYGYQKTGQESLFIVFYPLYPFLTKLIAYLVPSLTASLILVSTLFTFTCAIILFELTLLDFNKRVAILSVWFLNIFPLSYFLQASYTESLFLTTSMATIYFFRTRQFLTSTFFGILSSLTRINGLLLPPFLFLEWRFHKKGLLPILLTPLGFVIYMAINYYYFGEPFYFFKPLVSNWYKRGEWPWIGVLNAIKAVPPIGEPNFYIFSSEVIAIFFILIMTIYVLLKIRLSYGIYMLFNLLLITSTSFILSTPRYSLILFPIYIAFATIKGKIFLIILSGIFIPMLLFLTWIYTQGKWAS